MGGGGSKPKTKPKTEPKVTLTMMMMGMGGVGKSTVHKQVTNTFGGGRTEQQTSDAINAVRMALIEKTVAVSHLIVESLESDRNNVGCLPPLENAPEVGAAFSIILPGTQGDQKRSEISRRELENPIPQALCPADDVIFEKLDEVSDNVAARDTRKTAFTKEELSVLAVNLACIWSHDLFKDSFVKLVPPSLDAEMVFDMADRFSDRIPEVFSSDFNLSPAEYIEVRQPTKGMTKSVGRVKQTGFDLLDVGGQELFHEEWNSMIINGRATGAVLGVLYIISLDDYRHNESNGNRLQLSVDNWRKLQSNPHLIDPIPIPFIVLLNKVDLFKKTFKEDGGAAKFHQLFSKAEVRREGEDWVQYEERCIRYVQKRFEHYYKHGEHFKKTKVKLKSYVTCATDTAMVKNIFEKYVENIVEINFNAAGFDV